MKEFAIVKRRRSARQQTETRAHGREILLETALAPDSQPRKSRPRLADWQLKAAIQVLEGAHGRKIDISMVARACRLSASQFTRAFTNTVGMPPYHWSLLQRINRTKDVLLSTEMPIAQIADEHGFFDQAHFSNLFAHAVGMSPGKWRQLAGRKSALPSAVGKKYRRRS